jgi:hypothetical protein
MPKATNAESEWLPTYAAIICASNALTTLRANDEIPILILDHFDVVGAGTTDAPPARRWVGSYSVGRDEPGRACHGHAIWRCVRHHALPHLSGQLGDLCWA